MKRACVICGRPSDQSRCPAHRYSRDRSGRTIRANREFLTQRDGYHCDRCGATDRPLEVDHVLPLSRGGRDSRDNMRLLCGPCNRAGDQANDHPPH